MTKGIVMEKTVLQVDCTVDGHIGITYTQNGDTVRIFFRREEGDIALVQIGEWVEKDDISLTTGLMLAYTIGRESA